MAQIVAAHPGVADATRARAHSDARHAVLPSWWHPGVGGEYWRIGDELVYYGNETFIIFRCGALATCYPATRKHVEHVLVSRLKRLGWRALWRAPRVGRQAVMAYFEEIGDRRFIGVCREAQSLHEHLAAVHKL